MPNQKCWALLTVVLVILTIIGPPRATPAAAQSSPSCDAFNSRVWAQTLFDEAPAGYQALDPDDDGIACEALPDGIAPALWTDRVPGSAEPVTLEGVIDGDTIEVTIDGQRELVRLVGIDTREAGGPYQDVECFGLEASAFLKRLLAIGGQISLEQDQEDRDRFGRMLRWVWADFGTGEVYLLNEALIRAGFAERFRDTPNRRYVDELIDAEAFARRHDLGLWGACEDEGGHTAPRPTSTTTGHESGDPEPGQPDAACDPAYPDVCIPSPPPDLQCSDIPYQRFRVLLPDPHNFDGNRDGVACEGPG